MNKFKRGDLVTKISGSNWTGIVVGEYSTELTPEGYAVESNTEKGSVQIYPAKALKLVSSYKLALTSTKHIVMNMLDGHVYYNKCGTIYYCWDYNCKAFLAVKPKDMSTTQLNNLDFPMYIKI